MVSAIFVRGKGTTAAYLRKKPIMQIDIRNAP